MAAPSKYNAIWLSHSSIGTFQKCPRAYYLSSVYKDPKTRRKVHLQTTYMSLGTAVHNVLEHLKTIPTEERFNHDLFEHFAREWKQFEGKKGGFATPEEEDEFYARGVAMIENVLKEHSFFDKKTIKQSSYYKGDLIPNFYISEKDNLILCGSIDWIEFEDDTQTLRVIDLKTGKNAERDDSMQLPLYKLLLEGLGCKWDVRSGAYYYLDRNTLEEKDISHAETLVPTLIAIGNDIKRRRYDERYEPRKDMIDHFSCPKGGCRDCEPYEKIVSGAAEYVGVSGYDQDSYVIIP